MAITYDVPSNTITVTGGSLGSEYNFEDIYQADLAGGPWGVVTKQGATQYHFACDLELGIDDGAAGWLADILKEIEFGTGFEFNVRNSGHFKAGVMVDETDKVTKEGCSLIMDFNTVNNYVRCYGEFEFYSSILINLDRSFGQLLLGPDVETNKIRFWNSKVSGLQYTREVGDWQEHEYNWYRSNIENSNVGILMSTGIFPVEHMIDTMVLGCNYGIEITWLGYYAEDSCTVRNLYLKGITTKDIFVYKSGHNHPWAVYLIDAISSWTFKWTDTYTNGQVNRQYTFNLHIVDEDGSDVNTARVRCWDKDDVLLFDVNTDAGGEIAEQIITYGNYKVAQEITLLLADYADCIPSDIGKQVKDDGIEIGVLYGYDNATRKWMINAISVALSGSTITITDGNGAGTSTGNSVEATWLTMKTPHTLKITKTGYSDIDTIWDVDEPVNWILTLTHPCHPWTVDKINENASPGYDHSQVANYPMSWNAGANTLIIWGDDGSGGKEAMGYDAEHPITMEEIWAFCAFTKGTCICTKDSDDAFTMKVRLQIGDAIEITYFASEYQAIWLYDYFEIKNNAVMRIGSIATDVDNPYPDPKWNSKWTIERITGGAQQPRYFVRSGGEFYLYDSYILLTTTNNQRGCFDTEEDSYTNIRYSTIAGTNRKRGTYVRFWGQLEYDHFTIHHCRNLNFPYPPELTSHHLLVYDNLNNLQVRDSESWIYDAELINPITCAIKALQVFPGDWGKGNLVDPIGFDNTKVCIGNSSCWVKMWHRFRRKVIDENGDIIIGARVQVWDRESILIYNELTDINGWTVMQLIKEWQTKATTGTPLTYPDNFDIRSPFMIKISKDGTNYLTTEKEINIDKKMNDWEVVLMDVSDIVNGITDIKGTGFVKDTDSLINIRPQTDKMNFSGDNIQARVADKGVLNNPPSENIADYKDKNTEDEIKTAIDNYANKDTYKANVSDLTDILTIVKRAVGLIHENYRLFDLQYDSNSLLISATIKIYPTAIDCDNNTNTLAEYLLTAVYVDLNLTSYKVVKV